MRSPGIDGDGPARGPQPRRLDTRPECDSTDPARFARPLTTFFTVEAPSVRKHSDSKQGMKGQEQLSKSMSRMCEYGESWIPVVPPYRTPPRRRRAQTYDLRCPGPRTASRPRSYPRLRSRRQGAPLNRAGRLALPRQQRSAALIRPPPPAPPQARRRLCTSEPPNSTSPSHAEHQHCSCDRDSVHQRPRLIFPTIPRLAATIPPMRAAFPPPPDCTVPRTHCATHFFAAQNVRVGRGASTSSSAITPTSAAANRPTTNGFVPSSFAPLVTSSHPHTGHRDSW